MKWRPTRHRNLRREIFAASKASQTSEERLNPALWTGDSAVDALGREQNCTAKLLRLAQSSQVFLQRGEVGERRELIKRRDGVRGGHGVAL